MLKIAAIKKRISCRTYKEGPLLEGDRKKLEDFLLSNVQGPFGNRVRFEVVHLGGREQDDINTLATYGFIKGAITFIVGAVTRGNLAMEDYGYCMEKIILAATDWGLSTCWLGGTFNRSAAASKIDTRDNEVVPAITPVGYATDRKSILDATIRFVAKSGSRKAWEELFFHGDTRILLTQEKAGPYAAALECVRLGPSASNRQPWRVIKEKDGDVFHFHLSRTPGYAQKYPGVSLQDVDMGIAMCHFEVGVRELNQRGKWEILPSTPPQRGLEYIVSWIGEGNQGKPFGL
jgi:hypothetical protein